MTCENMEYLGSRLTIINCMQQDCVDIIGNMSRFSVQWFDCCDFSCVRVNCDPACWVIFYFIPVKKHTEKYLIFFSQICPEL